MHRWTIYILISIFAVLAALATYPQWDRYFKKPSTGSGELNFAQFTADSTEKFSIKKGSDEKVFTKEDGRWKVNEFDASQKEIENFFSGLKNIEEKGLASKNPENHTNFETTEETGYILTLNDTAFIIGKSGPDYDSFYAKKRDSNNVYLTTGSLPSKLSQDISAWRDKVLVDASGKTLQKVEIISKTNPLTITKTEEGKWQIQSGSKTTELEKDKADKLIAALSPLEATGFLDGKETGEFQKAGSKTILRLFDDKNEKLAEISLLEKDGDYWAQLSGRDVFYKLPFSTLSDILIKP